MALTHHDGALPTLDVGPAAHRPSNRPPARVASPARAATRSAAARRGCPAAVSVTPAGTNRLQSPAARGITT